VCRLWIGANHGDSRRAELIEEGGCRRRAKPISSTGRLKVSDDRAAIMLLGEGKGAGRELWLAAIFFVGAVETVMAEGD
jgi:hypothetical protein